MYDIEPISYRLNNKHKIIIQTKFQSSISITKDFWIRIINFFQKLEIPDMYLLFYTIAYNFFLCNLYNLNEDGGINWLISSKTFWKIWWKTKFQLHKIKNFYSTFSIFFRPIPRNSGIWVVVIIINMCRKKYKILLNSFRDTWTV